MVEHLIKAGARVTVTDIVESNIDAAKIKGPVTVVDPATIHAVDCDVFAPCALGGGLNPKSIPNIKATVIAGAANNQLENEKIQDEDLRQRGILYAPDYVVNAGGIISVEAEVHREKVSDAEREAKVLRIGDTLATVFAASEKQNRPTGEVANEMAEDIIRKASERKSVAAE